MKLHGLFLLHQARDKRLASDSGKYFEFLTDSLSIRGFQKVFARSTLSPFRERGLFRKEIVTDFRNDMPGMEYRGSSEPGNTNASHNNSSLTLRWATAYSGLGISFKGNSQFCFYLFLMEDN